MEKVIADTNVYLRFILDDVKNQADKAERLFKKTKDKRILLNVPQIVIFEIQFSLYKYYKFTKDDTIQKMEPILSANFLNIEDREAFLESIVIYKENNISFVDSFLIAKSKLTNADLFSFDRKLSKLKL